ncbi:Ankyrin repeat protein [Paragonimus heterotremus]|uniref:Ankyrin repeat protein n=1 Tax=Paragonimus heterotremus TaxID=100268 RepID=A0A8J4STS7_9TREM|nr:Ankyrin repeat protein [Paragonimus heterotremus]
MEETADVTKLIIEGNMEVLSKKLMNYPHLSHQQNEIGDFMAHTACKHGRYEVVMLLGRLEYDFNSEYNSMGFLPIHTACQYKNVDCVLALRLCGANIDAPTESDAITPMHIACRLGYLPLVQALMRSGAKCNTKDAYGNTPFAIAASMGHSQLMELAKGQMDMTESTKQCFKNLLKPGEK